MKAKINRNGVLLLKREGINLGYKKEHYIDSVCFATSKSCSVRCPLFRWNSEKIRDINTGELFDRYTIHLCHGVSYVVEEFIIEEKGEKNE